VGPTSSGRAVGASGRWAELGLGWGRHAHGREREGGTWAGIGPTRGEEERNSFFSFSFSISISISISLFL
jgi:hypothetical protein